MKRGSVVIILSLVSVFALVGIALVRYAKRMARTEIAQHNAQSLAGWVELYRIEHGNYPVSLDQLASDANRDLLKKYQTDPFGGQYGYLPSTNGFTITVTGPNSWFMKWEKLEIYYGVREAHRGLNSRIVISNVPPTMATQLPKP